MISRFFAHPPRVQFSASFMNILLKFSTLAYLFLLTEAHKTCFVSKGGNTTLVSDFDNFDDMVQQIFNQCGAYYPDGSKDYCAQPPTKGYGECKYTESDVHGGMLSESHGKDNYALSAFVNLNSTLDKCIHEVMRSVCQENQLPIVIIFIGVCGLMASIALICRGAIFVCNREENRPLIAAAEPVNRYVVDIEEKKPAPNIKQLTAAQLRYIQTCQPFVRAYLQGLVGKKTYAAMFQEMKLTAVEEERFEAYRDAVTYDTPEFPVMLNDTLYDVRTLIRLSSEGKPEPKTCLPFQMSYVGAAREKVDEIDNMIKQIQVDRAAAAELAAPLAQFVAPAQDLAEEQPVDRAAEEQPASSWASSGAWVSASLSASGRWAAASLWSAGAYVAARAGYRAAEVVAAPAGDLRAGLLQSQPGRR
jgi:hypothetical protein